MARAKVIDESAELTELARELIAEAQTPEADIVPEVKPAPREWSYTETARFQLTGEYPSWYKP
jgi:hypothetical protein